MTRCFNTKQRKILDEYGGTRGIVTINDLVEQLVGDLGKNETVEEVGYIELLEYEQYEDFLEVKSKYNELSGYLSLGLKCRIVLDLSIEQVD